MTKRCGAVIRARARNPSSSPVTAASVPPPVPAPAPRTLDRFLVQAVAEDETTVLAEASLTDDFYQPLVLPSGTAFIRVDTGSRKNGPTQTLLSDL